MAVFADWLIRAIRVPLFTKLIQGIADFETPLLPYYQHVQEDLFYNNVVWITKDRRIVWKIS
jgi:hypothetical protein